ncbi:unnamed protein product [Durusdinium trenchii]|uniref:Uncharacterized protein n=1 Tax=Durusdinium trenchii TaxID=1381693 RepID=A0ABP0IKJ6_9DINO
MGDSYGWITTSSRYDGESHEDLPWAASAWEGWNGEWVARDLDVSLRPWDSWRTLRGRLVKDSVGRFMSGSTDGEDLMNNMKGLHMASWHHHTSRTWAGRVGCLGFGMG